MIPILTKGMQEQQELIEAQETEIKKLNARLDKLEKMMAKIISVD